MLAITVRIERFTQDWQPGFVECSFVDAAGNVHVFEEKVPVVSVEDVTPHSKCPRDGIVACRLVARRVTADGREVVTVDTNEPWGIESRAGLTQFDVFSEQLVEFNQGAG